MLLVWDIFDTSAMSFDCEMFDVEEFATELVACGLLFVVGFLVPKKLNHKNIIKKDNVAAQKVFLFIKDSPRVS
jgi:hypothetical protein